MKETYQTIIKISGMDQGNMDRLIIDEDTLNALDKLKDVLKSNSHNYDRIMIQRVSKIQFPNEVA